MSFGNPAVWISLALLAIATYFLGGRLRLLRAQHPSLAGHPKIARFAAKGIPFYDYDEARFFACDDAPAEVAAERKKGFLALAAALRDGSAQTLAPSRDLAVGVSDVSFTNAYRVPFQFRSLVLEHLELGTFVSESSGVQIKDLDGNWLYDLAGSYGVNVFGYDFYKECIEKAAHRVRALGPVLGPYHPVVGDNVERLKRLSGFDEVSFHMSGTEAVMQAVRLARFHTRRRRAVLFAGAYHGWWDGVQPGIGGQRTSNDVYVLREMSAATLAVLSRRKDIACVLVNPLQALHANISAPGDGMLVDGRRSATFDKAAYSHWLRELRDVCSQRSIVLIFDEVFVGFRLAVGGAQEYFGVKADMVTYGKTLGGGLPVGVVCGKSAFMKRFRDARPSDICFARGTFNSHPYVMASMNEFLRRLDAPELRASYDGLDDVWDTRARRLNRRLADRELPVQVTNLASIWTVGYSSPSRYNWMFQYYLRAQGLLLGWVGTGRLIFSHNYSDADFAMVEEKILGAAERMAADRWWWASPDASNASIRRQISREILAAASARLRYALSR